MTTLTDREATEATRRRDAQQAGNFEVRHTDVNPWVEALEADLKLDAVQDNICWLAITTGAASLDQVEGRPVPGGSRTVPYFGSRYVEANYIARGAMQKLSVYCGIVWVTESPSETARSLRQAQIEATAEKLQERLRAVQVALGRHPELQVRSGGALHLHNPDSPWVAYAGTSIEAPPRATCGVCGVEIHFTNEHWRDASGRFEVTIDDGYRPGTRIPRKRLDHVHNVAGGAL
jgi:hypothetical protein